MITTRMKWTVFTAALLMLPLASCTDNPFESDPTIEASSRRIHGVVNLSDRDDNSGVYVWLEGFDLATTTDMNGAFALTLPPAAAQSTPGGAEGVFRLYTFLGNYRMQTIKTGVHDGAFVFPSTEVDGDGNIRETVYMQELFSISTMLNMPRIEADSPRVITVQVELHSDAPPVEVYFPRLINGIEGPVLLHNIGTGEVDIYSTTITGVEIDDYVQVGNIPYIRSMLLNIPKHRLKAGEYEIIPYLLPRNRFIPVALLRSLGTDISALTEEYVFYPFLRNGGRLLVTPN